MTKKKHTLWILTLTLTTDDPHPEWVSDSYLKSWDKAVTNYAKSSIGTYLPLNVKLEVNK